MVKIESEIQFMAHVKNGINLLVGAGFSIGARDVDRKLLPLGVELLNELKEKFQIIDGFDSLSKAALILERTHKQEFYEYLRARFKVNEFADQYKVLPLLNIKSIYTTNIDDLIYEIYKNDVKYINTTTISGSEGNENAVNYSPLHGCIKFPNKGYIFSDIKIATAYSNANRDWSSLKHEFSKSPLLICGWSFSDSDIIEGLYGNSGMDRNSEKWILIRKENKSEIEYYKALNFHIIIGDTLELLNTIKNKLPKIDNETIKAEYLQQYAPPRDAAEITSYELKAFFQGDGPQWSYFFSGNLYETSHYRFIKDSILEKKDIFVIGIPASGKSTIMYQLLYTFRHNNEYNFLIGPTESAAKAYVNTIGNSNRILFVDDAFRDVKAINYLLMQKNIQLICFDRDYIYEKQYNYLMRDVKIAERLSKTILEDVTEIDQYDIQGIIDSIPADLKVCRPKTIINDKTIFTVLNMNMGDPRFEKRFVNKIKQLKEENPIALELFVMICYVHSCGVPVSFDMIMAYLNKYANDYKQIYKYIREVGKIISECGENDNFSYLNVNLQEQDYYKSRSRYFANLIIREIPDDTGLLKKVMTTFIDNVSPYKICRFDVFKRNAFDAEYAFKAFKNIEEGEVFYEKCTVIDTSEYIYQQAALYFAKFKKYKLAFYWIDKAKHLDKYNKFSIENTHAIITFNANYDIVDKNGFQKEVLLQSLGKLKKCYDADDRKLIHALAFSDLVKKYCSKFNNDNMNEYIIQAKQWLTKELKRGKIGKKSTREINQAIKNMDLLKK